ncbi:MAG: histone-lysine N-methyltransferase [Gordonibacter sp.]
MPKHAANTPSDTPSDPDQRTDDGRGWTDADDGRIGLTEAFSPIRDDGFARSDGGTSDGSRENAIGLTEAFSPVPSRGPAHAPGAAEAPAHAGGLGYEGDNEGEYPDALESLEPVDLPPLLLGDDELPLEPEPPAGRHSKKVKPPLPPHQHKSRRMRRILIVVIVLLVLLIGALGFLTYLLLSDSQTLASQQTQAQQNAQEVESIKKDDTKDASSETTKKTQAPNLATLLGKTQDEAVAALKRGATVTRTEEVKEEGNPIKSKVTVALTDEPADARTGTPTVYLGLSEEGKIVQAGYSASTAALGYGSLSFADAVKNEHIVEKTLQEAGVNVVEGAAVLPADKTVYSTYDTDGTTLVKESSSFSGSVDVNGAAHEWSAVLRYDYTTANTSGNLADTIRIIYIYLNA